MDSDSDSGGSHISATPPRNLRRPSPPPPPSPPPAPLGSTLLSLNKPRFNFRSRGNPIAKPKSKSKQSKPSSKSKPDLSHKPLSPPPKTIPALKPSDLPFQIRSHSDQTRGVSNDSSVGNIHAGGLYLTKFALFSKNQRRSLNFESIEDDSTPKSESVNQSQAEVSSKFASVSKIQRRSINLESVEHDSNPPSESINRSHVEVGENLSKFGSFSNIQKRSLNLESTENDSNYRSESINQPHVVKVSKKHPNLIGNNVHSVPVKRLKCVNEGNFVKLNINGYGRSKFSFKGKNKNFSKYGGRRSYRSWKKQQGEGKGDAEKDGLVEEDGLVSETAKRQDPKEQEKSKFDIELIEEAVLGVRNGALEENLLRLLKLTHGYDSFRDGQLEAIKMVLSGKSVMVVLPTGAGKSLCYQLAAMVLPGLTLVVSPLVALMIDQLKQLPLMIQGGLLCSTQGPEEVSETLRQSQEGIIKVLFVSPERFLNAEFVSILSAIPTISLVVVDEAHCISEWSHNFRPSYMRLRASLLRAKLGVQSILAMTATATTKTLGNIMGALEIPPTNLIQGAGMRDNFQLSVSSSGNRMKDLMILIKSSPFAEVKSVIIYCKFQSETDLISKYLSDNNIRAKSYHSGIPAKERSRTQELFCSNKIRVVVATVAFGMGLDKRDVGAVIHYSLPESLEEYVQEIGRAGRDGRLSYCHLFFDDVTYFKLRSLMHSDGVDEYAVNRFLCQIFSNDVDSPGKIYSLMKESASRKFDMKEEVMLTILTHLELGETQYLHLLPLMNVTCTLNFHQTTPALLAVKDITVAAILKKSETKHGQYVFDMPTVANSIGVSAIDISNQLQKLKLKGEITYEMKDPAYCYTVVDVPKDFCSLAANLTKWLSEVESCKVQKIDVMYHAAVYALKVCDKRQGCFDSQHTQCLQRKILDYFNGEGNINTPNKMGQSSPFLRADIKVFLQSNSQAKFTPRAIARIMHGIASPAYPSATWSRTHFWGRYVQIDFQVIMEAAKAELMNFVGKDVN